MVVYKNVLEKLKEAGVNTNSMRKANILSESTLTRIRNNQPINTDSIDIICQLLHCTPNDIIEIQFNE